MADIVQFVSGIGDVNMLPNPSFAVDTGGWTSGFGTLTRVATAAVSGTTVGSYAATSAVAGQHAATFTAVAAIVPGSVYTASAYLKMQGTAVNYTFRIDWYNASSVLLSSTSVPYPSAQLSGVNFTRLVATSTAPAGTSFAGVFIQADTALPVASGFHVDAAMLTRSSSVIPFSFGEPVEKAITRLDVNDEVTWWVKSFTAPPPRLRRSMSANAMRDGVHVSASSYESRTVTLELEVRTSTQDATATAMQALWRELDRSDNYLMYQPTGSTKPVFFRLYRSDASQLEDVFSQAAMRRITIDLLAEPFALGLKETGSVTINNDPAAASNGLFADFTGTLGDVESPLVLWWSTVTGVCRLAMTHDITAPALLWSQAESLILGTDTTNPGGGPDAVMSGAGVNNYVTTSFATASATRLRWDVPQAGTFKVLVAVRRSDNTSAITANLSYTSGSAIVSGAAVAVPQKTSRQVVDLGTVTMDSGGVLGQVGYANNAVTIKRLNIDATRTSGAGTMQWDYVLLIPVFPGVNAKAPPTNMVVSYSVLASAAPVIDGVREEISAWSGGDPTAGTSTIGTGSTTTTRSISGAFPTVIPGCTNRLHVVHEGASHDKAIVLAINYAYWPRYLHVRPSAS